VDFNEARDDRVGVASRGPYANHLYHATTSSLLRERLGIDDMITVVQQRR